MSAAEHKFGVPKPLSIGQQVEVLIQNVNGHGEGISTYENMTIFVKNGRKNEKCAVRIVDVKRSYATAEKIL